MRVKILESAENDLESAYLFYERQRQGLGTYFLDSLYADIDSLVFFGGIHPSIFGYHRLLARRFPYAIYYRISDNIVIVMAVLDCRQDPATVKMRLLAASSTES